MKNFDEQPSVNGGHLKNEGIGVITLRWILNKWVVRTEVVVVSDVEIHC